MRYRVIQQYDRRYPIRLMCRAMAVSLAGYSAWRARPEGARAATNRVLWTEIQQLHRESRQIYGRPRIWQVLPRTGSWGGEHCVARLMRYNGLRAKTVPKWRPTTQSAHPFPGATNQLNRQFTVAVLNQVWAADLTYIWTLEGWFYLAVLLNLYSLAVVGWAREARLKGELSQRALHMALQYRHPKPDLLNHSNRGSHSMRPRPTSSNCRPRA
ncbi:MAG: Transposase [Nitrospira sp.]|jgi:transposase InsO family protein|nr:MAG: Transposase [Nitrospira sp.]